MKDKLAIHGGSKVRTQLMPARNAFDNRELEIIKQVFAHYRCRNQDFGSQGHYEHLYTDAFVQYLETNGFADAVNSGTSALFVSLASLQLPPGSHVLVSPVTNPGTINAIILNQLIPVIVDSCPDSYVTNTAQFEERITDLTKAVIIVHIAGKTVSTIDEIIQVSREKGIFVIEDCSQAPGARINGKKVGTFGDLSAFSTMYRKSLASGGCGGLVFTSREKLYNLVCAYADRGKPFGQPHFHHSDPTVFMFPALNLNQDEISCAIGLSSLTKLDDLIKSRLNFLFDLRESITRHSKVCNPSPISSGDSPFVYPISVDTDQIVCSKREFAQALLAEGIDLNPHYKEIVCEWHWVKPYLLDSFVTNNAIEYRDKTFNLYLNENYGRQEVEDIVEAIVKVESILYSKL